MFSNDAAITTTRSNIVSQRVRTMNERKYLGSSHLRLLLNIINRV